jgi:hypothetical protein
MKDDFDDGGIGLPDDEITGGSDLADMESGSESEVDIDLDNERRPGGRSSGGARARKAPSSRKPSGARRSSGSR